MFGFGKKKEKKLTRLEKTDTTHPAYQLGVKFLATLPKDQLKDHKMYAMMLASTMNKDMSLFFEMIRNMDDSEYVEWIEQNYDQWPKFNQSPLCEECE